VTEPLSSLPASGGPSIVHNGIRTPIPNALYRWAVVMDLWQIRVATVLSQPRKNPYRPAFPSWVLINDPRAWFDVNLTFQEGHGKAQSTPDSECKGRRTEPILKPRYGSHSGLRFYKPTPLNIGAQQCNITRSTL